MTDTSELPVIGPIDGPPEEFVAPPVAEDIAPPDHVTMPPGQVVRLPDRGSVFVRHLPAPPGAPTILLLHGLGATSDLNWFRSYDAIGANYGVLAMDHRGHGRGLKDGRRFRLDECADDAAALITTMGVGPCIAVGYSMGGTVAQLLWRRHPELVSGIVLCATAMNFRTTAREHAMFAAIGPTTAIGRLAPARFRNSTALKIMLTKDDRVLRLWAKAEISAHDWMRVLEAGSAIGSFDSTSWVSGINVPTAQIMTIDDEIVPLPRQEALANALPAATLHLVPGGHSVCIEEPTVFVPALVRAVDSVANRLTR